MVQPFEVRDFQKAPHSASCAVYGEFETLQSSARRHVNNIAYIGNVKRFGAGMSVQARESRRSAAFFV